jgi:phospholipid/cholesterol/gamma-HCH transport system substrate-binding protein
MKNTVGVRWGNLRVGILLTIVIILLFWASLMGGGTSIFQTKAKFVCYFGNIEGLLTGSPVWLAGVEVGNVRSIEFVNLDSLRQIKVVCNVRKAVWDMITEGSKVQLGTIGLIGDKYVEIIPGPVGGKPIKEWEVVPTHHPGSVTSLFEASEKAVNKAGNLVANLDTVLYRMKEGKGTLGQLSTNDELYVKLTALSANLGLLVKDLQGNQERLVGSIERMSKSIADLTEQVNENRGTLGKIITDPELYDNLAASTAKLDSIMLKINNSEGSMGMLVNDTALYVELTDLMVRVNNLVTDIQKNPKKYFKFSVF